MRAWLKARWKRLCAVLSLGVTALASTPYDMGKISVLIPPKWKTPAFVAGGFLFVVFQMIQRQHPKAAAEDKKEIHVYHHFVRD